ncbi:MAG: hypothetical protein ACOX7W_08570 [Christensenellales bacterium]|jgi:putative aldouronate transport system substrate-binding protein
MKRNLAKTLVLLLAAVLALSACTRGEGTPTTEPTHAPGTTQSTATTAPTETEAPAFDHDPNLNDPGVLPICKETVKLTIGLTENANVLDYETNDMTKLIEEQGNFDLEFQFYSSEMTTQINTVVAGGAFDDLPDVILRAPGDAYVYQWGQAGAIIPLNDYYEHSAYHLNIAKERTGVDFIPMITSPDGNIYGIPSYNQSLGNENPGKVWVYKPWLDALGIEIPKTVDEYKEMLVKFKNEDPNGNNKADEIPLLGKPYALTAPWIQGLVPAWQFVGNSHFVNNNGQVGVFYNTDGYREALKYIHSLIEEGLIPDYQFTLDITMYNNLAGNAEIAIVGSIIDSGTTVTQRVEDYIGIAPLKQADGTGYVSFVPSVANIAFMISAGCETPEAAFRLGDLLVSEDLSIMTRWGNQGQHWDYLKDVELDMSQYEAWYEEAGFPGYVIIHEDPWGIVQNFHWYQAGPFIRQYGIAAGRVVPKGQINSEFMIAQCIPHYLTATAAGSKDMAIPKLIYTTEETNATTETLANLQSYVTESTASFCMGQLDIHDDAAWQAYLDELDAIGLPEVLDVAQTVFDRMYGG